MDHCMEFSMLSKPNGPYLHVHSLSQFMGYDKNVMLCDQIELLQHKKLWFVEVFYPSMQMSQLISYTR